MITPTNPDSSAVLWTHNRLWSATTCGLYIVDGKAHRDYSVLRARVHYEDWRPPAWMVRESRVEWEAERDR